MSSQFSHELFERVPVVGILRGGAAGWIPSILRSLRAGGFTNLEITMNSPRATEQISGAVAASEGHLNIGAGTVTSLKLLDEALDAGASFIVTPHVVRPVIQHCVELGVPVFPGAMSPAEILEAWELGATLVKLFPAEFLGPSYVRSLAAPLPQVRLMPTGGVTLKTLGDYHLSGAAAYGVGSPLFLPEKMGGDSWSWLADQAAAFVAAYENARGVGT